MPPVLIDSSESVSIDSSASFCIILLFLFLMGGSSWILIAELQVVLSYRGCIWVIGISLVFFYIINLSAYVFNFLLFINENFNYLYDVFITCGSKYPINKTFYKKKQRSSQYKHCCIIYGNSNWSHSKLRSLIETIKYLRGSPHA